MSAADLFPESLRVSTGLGWVYTSSRKVAQYLGVPHHDLMQCIYKLNKDMVALDEKWGRGAFRLGVLTEAREDQEGEGASEWLLSRDCFLMLVMNLDGAAATQMQHRMIERFQQMRHEIDRLETHSPTTRP